MQLRYFGLACAVLLASGDAPMDVVSTEQQAIAIADRACGFPYPPGTPGGHWHAEREGKVWFAAWELDGDHPIAVFSITINARDGKAGKCGRPVPLCDGPPAGSSGGDPTC